MNKNVTCRGLYVSSISKEQEPPPILFTGNGWTRYHQPSDWEIMYRYGCTGIVQKMQLPNDDVALRTAADLGPTIAHMIKEDHSQIKNWALGVAAFTLRLLGKTTEFSLVDVINP